MDLSLLIQAMVEDHKPRQEVKKGDPSVAIRVEGATYETPKAYGRHFTEENDIYAMVTLSNRRSTVLPLMFSRLHSELK